MKRRQDVELERRREERKRAEVERISKIVGAYSRMPRSTIEKHVERMMERSRA